LGGFEIEDEPAMLGFNFIERAAQNDPALMHHGDVVRNPFDFLQQMG